MQHNIQFFVPVLFFSFGLKVNASMGTQQLHVTDIRSNIMSHFKCKLLFLTTVIVLQNPCDYSEVRIPMSVI